VILWTVRLAVPDLTTGAGLMAAFSAAIADRCMMDAMRDHDNLTAYLLELLAPLGPISARRMFGGVGLFHGGMMFGLIARDELFLKVSDANRSAYEAAGEGPFSYDTKHGVHTIQSYWRCPPELLDDAENFQDWARQAVEAAVVAARGKKPSRRPRSATPSSPGR
jgi:DNA transformation protein and related proteins